MGLPTTGSCPECGQTYDMALGQGVRSDAARAAERGENLLAWTRTGCLGALTVGTLLVGAAIAPFVDNPLRPIALAASLALVPLLATGYSLLRQFEQRQAQRQHDQAWSARHEVQRPPSHENHKNQ